MKNDFRARNHPAYWAFLAHRISGVLLKVLAGWVRHCLPGCIRCQGGM